MSKPLDMRQYCSTVKGQAMLDPAGDICFAVVTTVPSDGAAGYSKGCYLIDRDASAGSQVFINEGSNSSADFNAITTISGTATLTGKTLTSPTITGASSTGGTFTTPTLVTPTSTLLTEVVTTTNVLLAAESGTCFFLGSATGFVTTLPAPAAGLHFDFVVSTAPTSGSHTVICASSGTLIKGHILTNDVNSATDSDFGTAGELTLTFVVNKSVAGDRARFVCDGTNWFVSGSCSVFDAMTIS